MVDVVRFVTAGVRLRHQQLRQRVLDVRRRPSGECPARRPPSVFGVQAAQHLLGERNRAWRHAELAQPEPDQQRQQAGIGGHFTADGDRDAAAPPGPGDQAQRAEHGGMERLIQVGHAIVGPVDSETILDQIVGADAEEVRFARQQVGGHRG